MTLRRILTTAATLGVAALAGACAQQVGDIDRTSDNALEKSMFDGQWYMVQTVVDTNATAVYTFAGLQGPLERVAFDFDAGQMMARRVHENVPGLDTADTNLINPLEFEGSIVAAWPTQYFDIQRSYNPATGEESNVISENGSDRRWYEQDYVRVSWGNNAIITNANAEFSGGIESTSMIVLSPEESDESLFTDVNEDGDIYYFDYLTTYIAQADWWNCVEHVGFPNWGSDCGTEEIVVRTSFLRVEDDTVNAHVPRRYDDWDMNLFGFFRTNRCYFDDRYECTDYSRIQVANVYDIWDNDRTADGVARPYHERTPKPIAYYISYEYPIDLIDETYEITEQYSFGFRRAVAAAQGKSIEEIPRMFYACLNPGSTDPTVPQEYLDATFNPEDRALLVEAFAASAEAYELGICERPGTRKNQGDIRYSFFNWRTDPAAPWYGYGPSAADPLSGEVIHAAANFNGGHLNRSAEKILNYVRIIEGDLTPEEYGYGVPVQDYFQSLREEADYDLYYGLDTLPGADDKDFEIADLTQLNVSNMLQLGHEAQQLDELRLEVMNRPHVRDTLARPTSDFLVRNGRQTDPLSRLVDSPLEQVLMTPEFIEHMSLGNAETAEDVDEDWMEWVSPIRVARAATVERRMDRLRDSWMESNLLMAPDFDRQIVGFAEDMYRYKAQLETDFPELSAEEIEYQLWLEIRGRIYTGIQAHEIGHTVGFRHNFAGTADALNYFPQYWSLRQQTFQDDCDGDGAPTFSPTGLAMGVLAPEPCTGSLSAAESAEQSRLIQARLSTGVLEDGTELGSINHYEYSTVMDYHGEFNGRQGGLGLYDYAAIAYGYTEMVERFTEAPHRLLVNAEADPVTRSWSNTTVSRHPSERVVDMADVDDWVRQFEGGDTPADGEDDGDWTYWHYSVLPMMFWDESAPVNADAYPADHFQFDGINGMASMYDRSLVSASDCMGADCTACRVSADCAGGEVCYRNPLDPRQMEGLSSGYCTSDAVGVNLLDETDVRVPYRFCSDHRRGSSELCNIFDSGADELEVTTRIIADYENYYAISAFRRGRPTFGLSLGSYVNGLISYTFDAVINQYQFWLLNASDRGVPWYGAERGGQASYDAMIMAVNFVSSVWSTPTVGTYAPDVYDEGRIVNVSDETGYRYPNYDPRFGGVADSEYVDLGVADGARYGYSQFARRREDDQAGFYFFLQYEVLSHFWAKYAALISFTDGNVDVIGSDSSSDSTAYYIPIYLIFPEETGNMMGAIISEDFGNFGRCVTEDTEGNTVVENIDLVRTRGYECPGRVLNPYTEQYGNRDYNMKLYATIFSAANFATTYDYSWLDHSSVYVWGRGEQPDFINNDSEFAWLTYTDARGTTFAARYVEQVRNPLYDPTNPASEEFTYPEPDAGAEGPNVGYRMVQRAIDLQVEYDTLLVEEAASAVPLRRTSQEVYNELESHLEITRLLVETNKYFQF